MKTSRLSFIGAMALIILLAACQRTAQKEFNQPTKATEQPVLPGLYGKKEAPGPCNPNAYTVTLESRTQVNGNWEWVWSVQNPNPGNGNNGTSQDLSHWGMHFGTCVVAPYIIGAAYSSNGSNWTSFSPSYQVDPSQNCLTTAVLKFDYGTNGSAKSYYKLIVSQNFAPGNSSAYYKSGARTGCCTFNFIGISCDEETPI